MNQEEREQVLNFVTANIALIPVSAELYDEIYTYSRRKGTGGAGAVAAIAEDQLWDFLDRNKEDVVVEGKSVYWPDQKTGKVLELPHGTELGTSYHRDWLVAEVVDGAIAWDGKKFTTPAQVCNAMRGHTQNNAWKSFSVKRPGDTDYKPAQRLR